MRPDRTQFGDESHDGFAGGDGQVLGGKNKRLQGDWSIGPIEYREVTIFEGRAHRLLDQLVVLEIFWCVRKTARPKFHWDIASMLEGKRATARKLYFRDALFCRRARNLQNHS
jgi:hypothetical protein